MTGLRLTAVTNELILGPMLRHVDERSATIFFETERAGVISVLGSETSTFSVRGRHYALAIVDGLEPGSTTEYEVLLDGESVWPEPGSGLPPSVIRTPTGDGDVRLLIGSCRAAAPHEPPYTLESTVDHRGRGVDSLWAHAQRMAKQPPARWPTLLLLVGDQIYADDSSPRTEERIEQFRDSRDGLDPSIVATFEEYCWLYNEAWSPHLERWLFSVVPTIMIFDDHDMIDDWNISESWVADIHEEPWWCEHSVGGLMSYWIYQHLGNLSPAQIAADGLLEAISSHDDGTAPLRDWAERVDTETTHEPGYRFSFSRVVGRLKVIVIDCRCGRMLEPGHRLMLNQRDWAWVREEALDHDGHLVFGTSLPVFLADGLHDLHVWNERTCNGRWGKRVARRAEHLRRSLDLDDWPAFAESYAMFVDLIERLVARESPPPTIVVASGDIHFSYSAEVPLGTERTRVHQVVSSPIRNALIPPERSAMRFTLTRTGRMIGAALRRLSGAGRSAPGITMTAGPFFANNMCELYYAGEDLGLVMEHATPDGSGGAHLAEVAHVEL